MWIKQIVVNGFGKLKIRELNLEPGLNIIHGPNEAGKTSLACFIINALSEPGAELSRYEPWENQEFGGRIIYDDQILDVDFPNRNYSPPLKRKMIESIGSLFENERFDIHEGLDGTVVATLKRKMEETDTGRVLALTIDRIDALSSEIPSSITIAIDEANALQTQIERHKEKIAEYNRTYRRKRDLQTAIIQKERELQDHEKIYEKESVNYLSDIKHKISEMENELSNQQARYEELKWVETKSREDLSRVLTFDGRIKELKGLSEKSSEVVNDLKGKKIKIKSRLNETFSILKISSAEELEKVYLRIKNISFLKKMLFQKGKVREEYTDTLPTNPLWEFFRKNPNILEDVDAADKNTQQIKEKTNREIETVQAKLNAINPKWVASKLLSLLFLLMTVISLIVKLMSQSQGAIWYWIAVVSFLSAILSVIFWITSGKERNKVIKMMLDMEEYSAKNAWYNTPEVWQALNHLGIKTTTELRKAFIEYVNQSSRDKDKSTDLSHIRQIEEELENTLKEFQIDKSHASAIDTAIDFIEKSYGEAQELLAGMISIDEQLKNHDANIQNYEEEIKKMQIEVSEALIKLGMNLVEVKSFEETISACQETRLRCSELSNEIQQLQNKISISVIPEKLNGFNRNVTTAARELDELSKELLAVSEKLGQIEINGMLIQELHQKRDIQLRKLETMKATPKRLAAIKDLCRKQLNSYIGNYGKQFKEEFSKTFNRIVDRKVPVSIEENLTIRLPINGRLETPAGNLSKSAYDQMLFAYKLALYKTLSDTNIPLIIDNAFMNYDDARLTNAMSIIMEEARNRQVIILTSDQRLLAYSDHLIQFKDLLH